ncbi:hypothetical protein [Nocardioides lianchengensis]|uniref:Lipoprotein n=1 Tax=Nocardioides lianchengensis TaxID=1045774 RepID=A0A1G6ZGL2_9ACTN|nr:hypothetical protein [Nocardioides lianchengensis]NYG11384.1 hypothetical protein [Nocardioides lianchengensis]SDE01749.1 hypothetical protein SAMN05421872_113141 [Nocardioides lianchengensis]
MRRSLGILVLIAALSACGSDDGSGGEATDPGPSSSAPGSDASDGSGGSGWSQVALLTGSNGGGVVAETATPLPDEAAVTAFTGGLDDGLAAEVSEAAQAVDVPEGQALYGAVVSLECTPPTAVVVTRDGDDVLVRPRVEKESPSVQCLAVVTTVALVLVEE